jgi:hypothetical protein
LKTIWAMWLLMNWTLIVASFSWSKFFCLAFVGDENEFRRKRRNLFCKKFNVTYDVCLNIVSFNKMSIKIIICSKQLSKFRIFFSSFFEYFRFRISFSFCKKFLRFLFLFIFSFKQPLSFYILFWRCIKTSKESLFDFRACYICTISYNCNKPGGVTVWGTCKGDRLLLRC